jgi:hypothetical protein
VAFQVVQGRHKHLLRLLWVGINQSQLGIQYFQPMTFRTEKLRPMKAHSSQMHQIATHHSADHRSFNSLPAINKFQRITGRINK